MKTEVIITQEETDKTCTITIVDVIKNWKDFGECEVDIDKCIELWDKKLWFISQWNNEYTLIKIWYKKEDDEVITHKSRCSITKTQAHELIGKLDLINEKSVHFNSGSIWK